MKADDFNKAELVAGRLTTAHITLLVQHFQKSIGFVGAALDGKAGPVTRGELDKLLPDSGGQTDRFVLKSPLPVLADGREAVITSAFKPADRPDHKGIDLFYRWRQGDLPDTVGDRGAAGRNPDGTPKWVVPNNTLAVAAASGVVQIAGNSPTGFRCWIDHGNGLRTGYFHLLNLQISVGQQILVGTPLGLVGDNPIDHDGRHLHFEVSPVDRYAPVDPAPFLR
jgi:murein DD-endopeptidase MepM/ murein hydrolase activator NlpD